MQKDAFQGCFSALFQVSALQSDAGQLPASLHIFLVQLLFQLLEAVVRMVSEQRGWFIFFLSPLLAHTLKSMDKSQSQHRDQPELRIFLLRCKAAHTDSQPGTFKKDIPFSFKAVVIADNVPPCTSNLEAPCKCAGGRTHLPIALRSELPV